MKFALPAAILAALLALLAIGLTLDPREVPSPLIGKPVPAFSLRTLDGKPFTDADLRGRPVLVNFWASWCAGCQVEHPLLMKLARDGEVLIVGIDYKDTDEAARAWLGRHGNPYAQIVADPQGVAGLDFGVYGVPETFVLDAGGIIRYKQIGPLTEEDWRERVLPVLRGGSTPDGDAG